MPYRDRAGAGVGIETVATARTNAARQGEAAADAAEIIVLTQIISLPFGLQKARIRGRRRGEGVVLLAMRLRSAHATHESIRACPHYCQFICVIYALPPFEGARQTHTPIHTPYTHTHTIHTYTHHSDPCHLPSLSTVAVVKLFRASVLNSNQISLQIHHKSGRCCCR